MQKKYLITSALPYVNGELHIGHLIGCLLPSDVYARFCRMCGRDVLFVCGADENGTPSIVGAQKEGISISEYTQGWYEKQLCAIKSFDLSFDLYGRTHTELHNEIVQSVFTGLDKKGLIYERATLQPYSVDDKMFLADRQIEGICPKCGYEHARGDQCDICGATYEVSELKSPYSVISGSHNIEMRETKNLFFRLSDENVVKNWRDWLKQTSVNWSHSAYAVANGWAAEGLHDISITRDLPWGVPVNKPGYEDKVFYVWFDAPWGYVSISAAANKNWRDWWQPSEQTNVFYAQFMGKDNLKFHSVYFPAQETATGDNWKRVDLLKGLNFLNFEGAKISKSTGNGIFLADALNYAPSDCWRYALLASAPETDDTDFTLQRFADIVNKDLNGILGNFVSRVCKITEKNFGNSVPNAGGDTPEKTELHDTINSELKKLTDALEKCEFRRAVESLRLIWSAGNEYFTKMEPWALVKTDPVAAGAVLNECFQLIDFYALISGIFIPHAVAKMSQIFPGRCDINDWPEKFQHRIKSGTTFQTPENLFSRITDEQITEMTEKYVRK
ncbi:MAG: methionine--tRNA ligase [Rickettsiales bacterium]|jgi:methionyl-tRNA synthetase|nr:methionine--tRNA ligase [Rickettsiales bacterium]